MAVKPIPEGFHTVTPYLFAEGVPRLIKFILAAFDGEVTSRKARSDGSIIGDKARLKATSGPGP